jgi:hypothetical protein
MPVQLKGMSQLDLEDSVHCVVVWCVESLQNACFGTELGTSNLGLLENCFIVIKLRSTSLG